MYPDVEVINATMAGGSGTEAKAVLKIRILGADLPDSFRVHAGQEPIDTWVVADRMEDLTFLFAVTLTSGTGNEPITVAMSNLAGGRTVQCNLPMTGSIMATLPTLIVYLLLGRYFIRGLLARSVKGCFRLHLAF
jgi:hypothetical protein